MLAVSSRKEVDTLAVEEANNNFAVVVAAAVVDTHCSSVAETDAGRAVGGTHYQQW